MTACCRRPVTESVCDAFIFPFFVLTYDVLIQSRTLEKVTALTTCTHDSSEFRGEGGRVQSNEAQSLALLPAAPPPTFE
jgi:hypothetical protein